MKQDQREEVKLGYHNTIRIFMNKITVLVTAAGAPGPLAIIRILKGLKRYKIVAVDMNPYSAGLYTADIGYVVPPVSDTSYFSVLARILRKESVDIIIPAIDEELLGVVKLAQRLKLKTTLPRKEFVALCLNKLEINRALIRAGFKAPKTFTLKEFLHLPSVSALFPLVIKPRLARGARGYQRLNSKTDLDHYLANTPYHPGDLIVQEFIDGTEYTISVVVTQKGKVVAVVPKQVILKEHSTKFGITKKHARITKFCYALQEKFHANGPFNVQLITDRKTGYPYVLEVNPRFSSTVALTLAAGVNEVDITIRNRFNLPFSIPKNYQNNLVIARYEDQFFLPKNKIKKEASS